MPLVSWAKNNNHYLAQHSGLESLISFGIASLVCLELETVILGVWFFSISPLTFQQLSQCRTDGVLIFQAQWKMESLNAQTLSSLSLCYIPKYSIRQNRSKLIGRLLHLLMRGDEKSQCKGGCEKMGWICSHFTIYHKGYIIC